MNLTQADHSFMTLCELDAVDMPTPKLISAMRQETERLNHRQDYCTHAVRQSYLRLVSYRDVLQTRQQSIARYAN